jgi:PadR family transcriptional regulator AphA
MGSPSLTPTSYAILGLLGIQPWSTYELTKLMRRALLAVWPRAESHLYREPQRLVEAGLATASRVDVGRRRRTEYAITAAGRLALEDWLARPSSPTVLESEGAMKVLFGNYASLDVLEQRLGEFAEEAEAADEPWRAIARDYLEGTGAFPERIHVNVLYWVLLDRWARLRADWARWASAIVATWPDTGGPVDRRESLALLDAALEGAPDLLQQRPAVPARSGTAVTTRRGCASARGRSSPAAGRSSVRR